MLTCIACRNGYNSSMMWARCEQGGEYIIFNENLKRLRKEKGFSQEELAAKLNIVRQTISKWEKGLSVPDAQLLISLSEILEIPVSVLLGEIIQCKNNKMWVSKVTHILLSVGEQVYLNPKFIV